MTPIKLTMQAFGSYLNLTEIDFSHFASSGIFVICGQTGGGKTTILDGISAALYGEVTGSLRNKDRSGFFRCRAAGQDTDTELELIFSVHDKTYKFYRRWRMRKSGLTPVENSCHVRAGEEWILECSKNAGEVSMRATEILGLDREQFTKVICLPQGEFQKLLTSDSSERTKVFENLFGTGRWKMIKERVSVEFESVRREVSLMETGEQILLATVSCNESPELDDKIRLAKISADNLKKEHQKASEESERHAALTAAAAAFYNADRESKKAIEVQRQADAAKNNIAEKISFLEAELGEKFEIQISDLHSGIALLESAQKKLREISGMKNHAEDLQKSIEKSSQKIEDIERQIKTAEERIEKGRSVVAECEQAAQNLGETESRRDSLREICLKFAEIARLEAGLSSAKANLLPLELSRIESQNRLDEAKRRLDEIYDNHRRDTAYTLSRTLTEGDPCPVCGSAHPPIPAEPAIGAPGEKELHLAEKALEDSRKNLDQKTAAEGKVSAEISLIIKNLEMALSSDCIIGRNYEKSQNRLNLAEGEYLNLKKKIESIPGFRSAISKIECEAAKLRVQKEKLAGEISAAKQELAGVLASEKSALNDLPESLRIDYINHQDTLTKEIAEKKSALSDLTAKKDAYIAALLDQSGCDAAAKSAAGRVRETGGSLSAAENLYRGFQIPDSRFQNSDAGGLELNIAPDILPDLNHLKSQGKTFADSLTALARRMGEESQRLNNLIQASKKLAEGQEKKQKAISRRQQLETLKRWLCGENSRKTPIDQFVAGLLLDEVLMVANNYFSTLSRGQYALRRAEEAQGREHFQGVNLEVVDSHIGGVRQLSTLSGGELFLASLSLAFALTDVVQSFSGGISLGSLFIDEGFGSLDKDTLDACMKALPEIRGGRMIGIISHVDELRQRIPAQIRIFKEGGSSRAEIV